MWFYFVWKVSGFVWFPWFVSLFMLVVGDSGFGVSKCCTVEICVMVFPWCWLCWLRSWGHIFNDGLLFYKESFLVVCVLCNLKVKYPLSLLVGRHRLECQKVDVVGKVRVLVFE